nr:hypothetical protein [uncultured Flavobacterium sp.]
MAGIGEKILGFISGKVAEKGAGLVKEITGLVDESKFSAEEKAAHELKVMDAVNKYNLDVLSEATKQVVSEDSAVTDRWKSDMESDSWMSKNTRPLTMLSLLGFTFIIIIFDSLNITFEVKESYVSLLETLLITVVVAYFGSRGVEKYQTIRAKK